MSKRPGRATVLVMLKSAGYHSDTRTFTRLLIEGRVNRQAANEAWVSGVRAKAAGVGCVCFECKAS